MEQLSFFNLLSYGAIGFGCILAVLAYFLLRNEQDKKSPRKAILTSTYVFMVFALVLALVGFGAELIRHNSSSNLATNAQAVSDLTTELDVRDKMVHELQESNRQLADAKKNLEGELATIRKRLGDLMDLKDGKLTKLGKLRPDSPEYTSMVTGIQDDLQQIDAKINEALN